MRYNISEFLLLTIPEIIILTYISIKRFEIKYNKDIFIKSILFSFYNIPRLLVDISGISLLVSQFALFMSILKSGARPVFRFGYVLFLSIFVQIVYISLFPLIFNYTGLMYIISVFPTFIITLILDNAFGDYIVNLFEKIIVYIKNKL